MVTEKDIHGFLADAGISHSDTVLIHTSMRAIGDVEGGCDGLIDGFVSYLYDGLFLIPTHTWENVGEESPVYDVRKTMPCVGALPCVAAFRPDGVRSLHPTHSVAAFGNCAEEFIQGEEKATSPAPVFGVWSRLYDRGAKILLIGVGLNRNTYIHAIDEQLDLPDRLVPPISLTVIDRDGTEYHTMYQKHGYTGSSNFGVFEEALSTLGALEYSKLGNADVMIFDTVRGTEIIKHLWSVAEFDLCKDGRPIPKEYYAALVDKYGI